MILWISALGSVLCAYGLFNAFVPSAIAVALGGAAAALGVGALGASMVLAERAVGGATGPVTRASHAIVLLANIGFWSIGGPYGLGALAHDALALPDIAVLSVIAKATIGDHDDPTEPRDEPGCNNHVRTAEVVDPLKERICFPAEAWRAIEVPDRLFVDVTTSALGTRFGGPYRRDAAPGTPFARVW